MRAGAEQWTQWDNRDPLVKATAHLGTVFWGLGAGGLTVDSAARDARHKWCQVGYEGLVGALQAARACLLLHLPRAWGENAEKCHTSPGARLVLPNPCLGLQKPQLRSTWCSPEDEPQTLLCPSCALLAFGVAETGLIQDSAG